MSGNTLRIAILVALVGACSRESAPSAHNPPDSTPVDTTPPPTPRPLDVVLILTDDQRPITLAAMANTRALIFDQGVEFPNTFATTPLCCPSRASILTGLYTHNHGVLTNFPPLGGAPAFVDTSTIATWLAHAGYRTGYFGKYLNSYNDMLPWPYRPPGWSVWNAFKTPGTITSVLVDESVELALGPSPSEYSTDVLATRAVQFIQSTPANQPLFLFFAPYAPHVPADPALQDQGAFSSLPPWRPPSYNEADVSDKPGWVQALAPFTQVEIDSLDARVEREYESLLSVDRAVQQIVNALTLAGRLDSTVIIFTSDNGLSWGEHRWSTKNCVYEECILVPMAIRAPGIAPRQDAHLVELVDLAPTIAHYAKITMPHPANGMDLAPLLENPGTAWRSDVLLEVIARVQPPTTEALFSAIRTDRYVYVELTTGERELYDLSVDPYQLDNLAADPAQAALMATLSARLQVLKSE
jgi:arylsulfatase A-like enzyme